MTMIEQKHFTTIPHTLLENIEDLWSTLCKGTDGYGQHPNYMSILYAISCDAYNKELSCGQGRC